VPPGRLQNSDIDSIHSPSTRHVSSPHTWAEVNPSRVGSLGGYRQAIESNSELAEPETEQTSTAEGAPIKHGPWVDIHAHPGACFLRGFPQTHPIVQVLGSDRTDDIAAEIASSAVTVTSFSSVADLIVLGVNASGGLGAVRELEDAEAVEDHDRQLAAITSVCETTDLEPVVHPDDVERLHRTGKSGYFISCEGGDFIGTDIGRVAAVASRGVCSITLVHYRVNALGDIQTEDPVHGGLTDVGREVVEEMNRMGMIVDLAHATKETTETAAAVSAAPIIVSHSHLASSGSAHPRLLDEDHASIIAESGGVVGAWPSGIVAASIDEFVDEICRLIDVVGLEHVAIGTDMDANYKPVVDNYAQIQVVATKLAAHGYDRSDVDAVMGGNFLRVWRAVRAGKT